CYNASPSAKSSIALKKPCNKDGTFAAKVTNEIEINMDTLENCELFEISHETFHDYVIEWHENTDKKLKSTFYTDSKRKISASEKIVDNLWKGKIRKRALLLDDKNLKLAACTWLRSISLKDHFPLALKKELDVNIFSKSLGVPITISENTI
ncbi:3826_t:CDS:2, partial [Gigaspora rosea]